MELIQASPHHSSPHKQAIALTYSNRGSSLSLDTRPVPQAELGEVMESERVGERKLSNCIAELMPFNLLQPLSDNEKKVWKRVDSVESVQGEW